jgi:hypothetical protein
LRECSAQSAPKILRAKIFARQKSHVHWQKFAGEKLATTTDNALATLGGAPKIGSFLFQSLDQGKKARQYRITILLMFSLINFVNVNEPNTGEG